MHTNPSTFRQFIELSDELGDVVRETSPVSPVFEIAAHLVARDPGPITVFSNVEGWSIPVVGNVLGSLERIALAIGAPVAEIQSRMIAAIAAHDPVVEVTDAACQEVVATTVDLARMPIPTFFEREGGPYITAGVIIARDPITGEANASFARVRPLGGARALMGIAPNHHLQKMAEKAEDGRLEIAVVLGAHPAVQLAACFYLGLGDDELQHVQSLTGEPLRVVRAKTVDLLVPADAEIVLEGVLDIRDTVVEGDVSEYHGMYENYGAAATVEFTAMTSRADPMLQVILPGWHREHAYLGAVSIAAGLRVAIARSIPNVGEVSVTEAGAGRLAAVITLHNPRPGQGKQAMLAAWGSLSMLKQVTVVDADIDVWDPIAVEWARITRCRFDRDLVVIAGMRTDRSEPLEHDGVVTKIGFDALIHDGDRVEGFDAAEPPAHITAHVRAHLDKTSTHDDKGQRS